MNTCAVIKDKLHDKKDSTVFDDWIQSKSSGKVIPAKQKIDNFLIKFNEELKERIADSIETNVDTKTVTDMGLQYETDYLTVLAQLTKSIDSTFKVLTVPQLSYRNHYQCMIHVIPNDISYSELPVLTAWGAADQLEDAKQTAAGNAIKLLSLLSNKTKESI